MPTKKSAAEECCAKCEKDIAALKKEIAALKKEFRYVYHGSCTISSIESIQIEIQLKAESATQICFVPG